VAIANGVVGSVAILVQGSGFGVVGISTIISCLDLGIISIGAVHLGVMLPCAVDCGTLGVQAKCGGLLGRVVEGRVFWEAVDAMAFEGMWAIHVIAIVIVVGWIWLAR